MKARRGERVDADLLGAQDALERAAARARRLAEETRTALYVVRDNRIVDLNARRPGRAGMRAAPRPKG